MFTYSYEYDAAGRVILEKGDCLSHIYSYDSADRLTKDEFHTCSKTIDTIVYTYNAQGLLTSLVETKSNSSTVYKETHSYTFWQ